MRFENPDIYRGTNPEFGTEHSFELINQIVRGWHSKGKPNTPSLEQHTANNNSQDMPDLREVIRHKSNVKKVTGCWHWSGARNDKGYGQFYVPGLQSKSAHRISAHAFKGFDLSPNIHVCHSCDNPSCVNPEHLFLGSPKDNVDDMVSKGRGARGENSKNSKLSEDQVKQILKSNQTSYALAKHFGVSTGTVINVRNRKTWKHVNA